MSSGVARGWRLGAYALLSGITFGCSSGSISAVADASAKDAGPVGPPANDASPSNDSSLPPPVDAGLDAGYPDVADAAPDVTSCAWDGSFESPACGECLRGHCCAATSTCEGDPQCVGLDTCVNGCLMDAGGDGGISNCAQQCADSRSSAARAEFQALSDCVEFSCNNQGAGPCQ